MSATTSALVQGFRTVGARVFPTRVRATAAILTGGVLLSALVYATAPANEPAPRREKAWAVATIPAALVDAAPELRLFGRVETPRAATLSLALTAEVLEVLVDEGQVVRRDQLLVRLDDREARLAVAEREADVASAAAELDLLKSRHATDRLVLDRQMQLDALAAQKLDRHQQLADRDMLPPIRLDETRREAEEQAIALEETRSRVESHPAELQQHRARLELVKAQLDRARLDLSRTEIRAPFDGRIASVAVAPGERLMTGDGVLEIYDIGALEVRAQIPSERVEALRQSVHEGGAPLLAHAEVDGARVELRLDRLAGRVARGRGGVDALFRVSTRQPALQLDQVVELDVLLPTQNDVTSIPIQALYGDSRIYTVVDGRLRAMEVERVGERAGTAGSLDVLVRSPELRDGDPIAVTQLPRAIDGLKVDPSPAP